MVLNVRRFGRVSGVVVMAALVGGAVTRLPAFANPSDSAAPPGKPAYACRIGKPSYCYKYGGNRCPKVNTISKSAADVEKACDAWTAACLECHAAIPACIGSPRPSAESLRCVECSGTWRACMEKIDAAHWPNRLASSR